MNAISYINKTGCQWRLLPRQFGPWQTVYYYFRKWKLEGTCLRISWILCIPLLAKSWVGTRVPHGNHRLQKHEDLPLCWPFLQGHWREQESQKRIVVDTLGLPMAVAIHEVNIHDSKGTPNVIEKFDHKFPRLTKVLADGGYHGTLGEWVSEKFGWIVEVVLRPDECPTKFPVLLKRWIVERSFA